MHFQQGWVFMLVNYYNCDTFFVMVSGRLLFMWWPYREANKVIRYYPGKAGYSFFYISWAVLSSLSYRELCLWEKVKLHVCMHCRVVHMACFRVSLIWWSFFLPFLRYFGTWNKYWCEEGLNNHTFLCLFSPQTPLWTFYFCSNIMKKLKKSPNPVVSLHVM